jgi:hypothetical protein
MAIHREFIWAWRKWQRRPVCINLKQYHDVNKIHYVIHELDHQASHVYSLSLTAIEGKKDYVPLRASEELARLEKLVADLANCVIVESDRDIILNYVKDTESLLIEMSKLQ